MSPQEIETELLHHNVPIQHVERLADMTVDKTVVDAAAGLFAGIMFMSIIGFAICYFLVFGFSSGDCEVGVALNQIASLFICLVCSILLAGWIMSHIQMRVFKDRTYSLFVAGFFHEKQRPYSIRGVKKINTRITGNETLDEYVNACLMAPLPFFKWGTLLGITFAILSFLLLPSSCI